MHSTMTLRLDKTRVTRNVLSAADLPGINSARNVTTMPGRAHTLPVVVTTPCGSCVFVLPCADDAGRAPSNVWSTAPPVKGIPDYLSLKPNYSPATLTRRAYYLLRILCS